MNEMFTLFLFMRPSFVLQIFRLLCNLSLDETLRDVVVVTTQFFLNRARAEYIILFSQNY